MIYRKDNLKNFSHKTAAELSMAIGEQWKNEPPSVRAHYSQLAEEARLKHMEEHPQYKFTPKKRSPYCPKSASKENESTSPAKEQKNVNDPVKPSKAASLIHVKTDEAPRSKV
ncbi:hypothetical protein BGZ79_011159 [Entomortierella chlamydospora]|nr:hypothetical protein BGZ79_011159 [Entomortierella chlamydospora]